MNKISHILIAGLLMLFFVKSYGEELRSNSAKANIVKNAKVKITIGELVVFAKMDDNPTSKDFMALLPLTLNLKDFNATEKIGDLSKKLSTKEAPNGSKPSAGDIAYYAPWGNLAIFYKDFDYSPGLIILGKIESRGTAMEFENSRRVKFELAD